jgi:hypothetical protein
MWILHYDIGRFDPSKIIRLMAMHWEKFHPERIGIESVYYQKAIGHFAREYMFEGKIPMMTIVQLKPEGGASKDIRIQGLEPLASNLGIHCKPTHKEFITEFTDFVPNNRLCKKDILDALAYQMQIARPGQVIPTTDKEPKTFTEVNTIEKVLEEIFGRTRRPNPFGHKEPVDPFSNPVPNDDLSNYNPYNDPYSDANRIFNN